jgi:ribosomal protein S18 acetylase RimI-like enzyme
MIMDCTLRPAVPEDLKVITSWIENPEMLKRWGGPLLTFPPDAQKTWSEIQTTSKDTFSLIDQGGNVIGFAQTSIKEPGAVHLGRIIVSPAMRGMGLGRRLLKQLIQLVLSKNETERITLNVYRDNLSAYSLYKSLGFVVISEDDAENSYGMCLQMKSTMGSTQEQ